MGLALEVGILSDLKANDEEGYEAQKSDFAVLNAHLESLGLSAFSEPENIAEKDIFSCDMIGYGGLHHLRRLAAYDALGKEMPEPVDYDKSDDPIVDQYDDMVMRAEPGYIGKLFSRRGPQDLPYQHLMFHSDAEGYYIPIDFKKVIFPPASLNIPGGMVGSVQQLQQECNKLKALLEIPGELNLESEALYEAVDEHPGKGEKWQRYAIETYSCICLLEACKVSLATGAVIVFT